MKKALIVLVVIVALAGGLAAWFASRPRRTAPGQPSLESLNPATRSDFQKAFNRSPSSVRMVLLLSPT